MKIGVAMRVGYEAMPDVAAAADDLGYESLWLPEHLVFPVENPSGGPVPGENHIEYRPSVPTYDVLIFLAVLAVRTARIRLGTWVYNLALRHPLVSARAVQTLDIVSRGRVLLGVGAGWIRGEYEAAGVDFTTRGRRLDECIDVLRLLWEDEQPEFDGEFVSLPPVVFEPKPVQGRVPILVGGESTAALRRAARRGDGWIGMAHTPDSARAKVARLREYEGAEGRAGPGTEVTVGARRPDADEIAAYANAGVDRVIVTPWDRGADPKAELERYAREVVRKVT